MLKSIIASMWDKIRDKLSGVVDSIFKQSYADVSFEAVPSQRVLQELEERVIVLCDKHTALLTGNLDFVIKDGIKNGLTQIELKKEVRKVFDGSDYDVERIVRTELLNANEEGTYQANRDMGAQWKVWAANMSNKRTAEDSKRLNGQVRPIDEPFVDPETGKKCQHSPNRSMCRCSISYYIDKPATTTKYGMEYIK